MEMQTLQRISGPRRGRIPRVAEWLWRSSLRGSSSPAWWVPGRRYAGPSAPSGRPTGCSKLGLYVLTPPVIFFNLVGQEFSLETGGGLALAWVSTWQPARSPTC